MTGAGFVVRMAWREARAAHRRLVLLAATVSAGVGALVAINGFTDNLRASIESQARVLLGADLSVSGRRPLTAKVDSALARLPEGSEVARVTSFAAMAYVPRTTGTRLVQVAAIDGGFPFYGEIRTEPAGEWPRLHGGRRVLVDPSLLTSLGAAIGDTLALGEARFVIAGSVQNLPGDVGVRAAFGPRAFIPAAYLAQTGLLGFGARAQYEAFVRLPAASDPLTLAAGLRKGLASERVSIRTVSDDQRDLNDRLGQLARYLGLVALIALLLGGIGVASATNVFIRQKLETIAVLRCLGARAGTVFAVYLVQAGALGVLGSVAGVAGGVVLQFALARALRGMLPVDIEVALSWRAMVTGLASGAWVAFIFALLPLLAVRGVSPLAALRRPFDPAVRPDRDRWRWPARLVLAASLVGLAVLQVGKLLAGAWFAGGIGLALGVLALAAFGLIRGLRRWFPHRLPYLWRQGLANLYRPANQTLTVVLALGFGVFLLGTLFLIQYNLLRGLAFDRGTARPNMILFDIQPDQRAGVEAVVREAGFATGPAVPIVPMRIQSIGGKPVSAFTSDSSGERWSGWAYRREYRSTYRDTTVGTEQIVAGKWAGPSPYPPGPIPVSLEVSIAAELGVHVGDEIVWDVQGVPLPSRVVNLREVEWARFEPNFYAVFPEGPLDAAPQSFVEVTRVDDAEARVRLQRRIVERFSNVSTIDLSQIQRALSNIVSRMVLAIRFMALFSLATGAVVLVGALATSRYQRIREGVLLKTLGATRAQLVRIAAAEYLSLGLLSGVTALALSIGAAWAVMRFVFDLGFRVPAAPAAGMLGAVVAVTVLVGLWNTAGILRRTPLEVLRAE